MVNEQFYDLGDVKFFMSEKSDGFGRYFVSIDFILNEEDHKIINPDFVKNAVASVAGKKSLMNMMHLDL